MWTTILYLGACVLLIVGGVLLGEWGLRDLKRAMIDAIDKAFDKVFGSTENPHE